MTAMLNSYPQALRNPMKLKFLVYHHQFVFGIAKNVVTHFLFIPAQSYVLAVHLKLRVALPSNIVAHLTNLPRLPGCARIFRELSDLPDSAPALQ